MAPGRRTRILIVDDSAVMRSLLRSVVVDRRRPRSGRHRGRRRIGAERHRIPSPRPGSAGCGDAGDGRTGHAAKAARAGTQNAGDHVQFAHPARRQGHHRSSGLRRLGLCGQARRTIRPRGGHASARAGSDSQDSRPHQPAAAAACRRSGCAARIPLAHARCASLPKAQPISSVPAVLAIGVSTGGPAALDVLLPALPANFPLPVLIVQHMPELFTRLFAERLNGRCRLQVREAVEGDPVRAGTIYIATRQLAPGGAGRPRASARRPRCI